MKSRLLLATISRRFKAAFNTRLRFEFEASMRLSSVPEKTEPAELTLQEYAQQKRCAENLFTFEESRGDLVGYASQTD